MPGIFLSVTCILVIFAGDNTKYANGAGCMHPSNNCQINQSNKNYLKIRYFSILFSIVFVVESAN